MRTFYQLIANSFVAACTVSMVWFALGLWVYVQTNSVLMTSLMYGIYMIANAVTGIWFGSIVDHKKKKTAMLGSGIITLATFIAGFIIYNVFPPSAFATTTSVPLWALILFVFCGVIVANIRNIAIPTVTTLLVPEDKRDKANGLSGTIFGMSFLIASIASGFLLASSGLFWIMIISITLMVISILHLLTISIPEKKIVHIQSEKPAKYDFLETIAVIRKVPGLLELIFFTCFNNFLGGVFMPLLDPYGLSLVSLSVWGVLWGFLSLGFIAGGLFIAKFGLGKNPLATLFRVNIVLWITCIFFAIQPSIILLTIGMLIYICLVPFIEASEHTIIQKIVPQERQGRVFGFSQTVEGAASPLTTLAIGPIAQFIFIPFMTTGGGVALIGSWFGTGDGRGIALVFTLTGIIGLCVTVLALRSRSYALLSRMYAK